MSKMRGSGLGLGSDKSDQVAWSALVQPLRYDANRNWTSFDNVLKEKLKNKNYLYLRVLDIILGAFEVF